MECTFPQSLQHQLKVVLSHTGFLSNRGVDDGWHCKDGKGNKIRRPNRSLCRALALAVSPLLFRVPRWHHDSTLSIDALHGMERMGPSKLDRARQLEIALCHRVHSTKKPDIHCSAAQHLFHVTRIDATLLLNLFSQTSPTKEGFSIILVLFANKDEVAPIRPTVRVSRKDIIPDVSLDAHIGEGNSAVLFTENTACVAVVERIAIWDPIFHALD